MGKKVKRVTGGASIKVTGTEPRKRGSARDAMVAKLQRLNSGLGRLLTPRYASAGQDYVDLVKAAQEAVVQAGLLINAKPDSWQPSVAGRRAMTPERLEQLRAKAAELAARIKAAEAVL